MTVPYSTSDAVQFLQGWAPEGPWVLTSILPDKGPDDRTDTATFTAKQAEEMGRWIDDRQGQQNIYFTVNRTFRAMTIKPKKLHIAAAVALHVDVDPRVGEDLATERERALRLLREYKPSPTVIIDSGGGYQGFWLLDAPVDLTGEPGEETRHHPVEDRNLQIETVLQADSCHNIDRIMRLPGTVNLPNKKKRAAGRKPALAQVVEVDWTRLYPLDAFTPARRGVAPAGAPVAGGGGRVVLPSDLPAVVVADLPVSDHTKMLIVQGIDPDNPNEDRSKVVWQVACQMVRDGCTDSQIAAAILDPDNKISGHVLDQPKPRQYAARQIERARVEVASEPKAKNADNRPTVVVDYNRLHLMLDAAEDALLASGLALYQRAGAVVAPVRHQRGSLRLRDVSATAMRELMTAAADFTEESTDKDGNKRSRPAYPEPHFTQAYVERAAMGTCRLPECNGLVGHPTIRPDGSLLWAEGFDRDTGLIVDYGGTSFPAVPDAPTMDEATAALAKLKEVIKDFPFVDDASRSVALSAILTAVCRRSLDFAPAHAFNAPSPETGKSLLSDLPAMIATGHAAAKHAQEKDPEEDQKSLLGVLMQGDPVVVIDNVDRPIEGATWCLILTTPEWEKRGLGSNANKRVLTNVLFIFNGNNIEFRGDMATRAIMATIDAGVEEPAARTFDVDLRDDVPRRRGELVSAALTVLRGHVAAGLPGAQRDTRFRGWSQLVRGALIWLGEADPWETRHAVRGGDSARDEAVRLMDALEGHFHEAPFSARAVCDAVAWEPDWDGRDKALANALSEMVPPVTGPGPGVNATKLGYALKRMKDRVVRGRKIVFADKDKVEGNLWRIVRCGDS